jgi:hypothetical protein
MVVAHPDDEILWFSSLLKRVDHIVFCFSDEMADPEFGARRRKTVENYPFKNTSSLDLAAVGVQRPQSFVKPRFNEYGLEIVGSDRLYSAHLRKYKENYYDMRDRLAGILSQYRNVFTHNPWGEYGHEEHVQVHRVVCEIQKKACYDTWYSGYCSTRTVRLIDQCACGGESITLPTDVDTAERLMEMYERNGCWTWYTDWRWAMHETFFKRGLASSSDWDSGRVINLNLIVLPTVSGETSGWCLRVYRRLRTLTRIAPFWGWLKHLRKLSELPTGAKRLNNRTRKDDHCLDSNPRRWIDHHASVS